MLLAIFEIVNTNEEHMYMYALITHIHIHLHSMNNQRGLYVQCN